MVEWEKICNEIRNPFERRREMLPGLLPLYGMVWMEHGNGHEKAPDSEMEWELYIFSGIICPGVP